MTCHETTRLLSRSHLDCRHGWHAGRGAAGNLWAAVQLITLQSHRPAVPGGSDDLGTWEPEIKASQQLRNLWDCIHDGWWAFQFQIRGFCRALQGYTYADWLAEMQAESGRNLESYRNGAEVEPRVHALIQCTGNLPQPSEEKRFASTDLSGEIHQLAAKTGWRRLHHLIEVMERALASPQGQRAADRALDQLGPDPSNPWQGACDLINCADQLC